MGWDTASIVEAVAAHLRARAEADDIEQAVYSIDAMEELQLHPLIQAGLREQGWGVWPEQRYPSDRLSRRKTEGRRCDVVLTPDGRPLVDPDAETTLFEPADAVPLEAAFWLEIKTVAQHTTEGPFPRYAAELLQPVSRDIKKMASDRWLYHSGLMLVLFNATAEIAEHDLHAWQQRVGQRGYPIATPTQRGFALNDRLGNAWCSIALFPVRRL